jgi:hypothetical protein
MKHTPISDTHYNAKAKRPKRDYEIFVDLDGVLGDFDTHARVHAKYDAKGSPKWEELDTFWWSTMPAYDGMREFYDGLNDYGNVRILTSPTMSVDCYQGKAEWVQANWPEKGKFALGDLIICRSTDKHFLARPNHILIDDRIANINDWVAAGGIGIHHTGDYADTMRRVKEAIDDFKKGKKPQPPAPKA